MVGECLAWLRRSVFVVRHADKRVLASVVLVLAGGGGIEGAAELLAKLLAETAQLLAKLVHRALELLAVEAAAELEELLEMEVTPDVESIDIPITENLLLSANDIGLLTPFVHFTEE